MLWLFLKIPAIVRTNLCRRTRSSVSQKSKRASQPNEQREARNEIEQLIDGIEINDILMLRLTLIELHSIITWKSTVYMKSLLLKQWTLCANIVRHLSLKMKLLDCVLRAVKSNWRQWPLVTPAMRVYSLDWAVDWESHYFQTVFDLQKLYTIIYN